MSQDYTPGDFLVFQIESGYGLLRLLAVETDEGRRVWHLAAYREMFLDVDSADQAVGRPENLTVSHPHLALTTRAFESTQTARLQNQELLEEDLMPLQKWRENDSAEISDRSVRLLLGLR